MSSPDALARWDLATRPCEHKLYRSEAELVLRLPHQQAEEEKHGQVRPLSPFFRKFGLSRLGGPKPTKKWGLIHCHELASALYPGRDWRGSQAH